MESQFYLMETGFVMFVLLSKTRANISDVLSVTKEEEL